MKGHAVTIVNFYDQPEAQRIAENLYYQEIVVYSSTTTGAEVLVDDVKKQVAFTFDTRTENTILPWDGEDYFVIFRGGFDYDGKKEELRAMALQWAYAGRPDQAGHI